MIEIAEPLIIISIGESYQEGQSDEKTYEDVRNWWIIADDRRDGRYQLVLARYQDRIVGAYRPQVWIPYQGPDPGLQGKYEFVGERAEFYARRFYVGKWVPPEYRTQNPVRYFEPGD